MVLEDPAFDEGTTATEAPVGPKSDSFFLRRRLGGYEAGRCAAPPSTAQGWAKPGRDRSFLPDRDRSNLRTNMTATATLSSRFHISIPKAVREEQHWQAGQEFAFVPRGKGVLLMPVAELERLAGIARTARKGGVRDRQDRY